MGKKDGKGLRVPKTKCCVSASRCGRCPIRLLSEGNLPDGYGVKKRRLVRTEPILKKASKKKATPISSKKITKSELEKAIKRTKKQRRTSKAA